MNNFLPLVPQIVSLQAAVTTNAANTSDYINCAKAEMIFFVCQLQNAAAQATVLSIYQATSAAAAGEKVIANAVPIWYSNDTVTTSNITQATAAVSYTVSESVKEKMVIFQLDPAALDLANDFAFAAIHSTASTELTNFISVVAVVETRHGGYDQINLLA